MTLSELDKIAGPISFMTKGLSSLGTLGTDIGHAWNSTGGMTLGKALKGFAQRSPLMAYGVPAAGAGFGLAKFTSS